MKFTTGKLLTILAIVALLAFPALMLTGCSGGTTTPGATSSDPQASPSALSSEEASERDSIESTSEELIEQNNSEESSENDSIESPREEQIENGTAQ